MLSAGHWQNLLYVAAGLCVIFIFWSRSVIHTLTLIKWPLEFGHNFFYIACALGEAIPFSRVDRPLDWFQLSAVYAAVVWLLFIYDMRLIHTRIAEASSDADHALYIRAKADQLLNICLLVPLLCILNLACAVAIGRGPICLSLAPGMFGCSAHNYFIYRLPLLHWTLLQRYCAPGSKESIDRLKQSILENFTVHFGGR